MASEPGTAFRQARALMQRNQIDLFGNTRDEIIRILELGRDRVLAQIAIWSARGDADQVATLTTLEREIMRLLNLFGEQAATYIGPQIEQAWQLGIQTVDQPLQAAGIQMAGIGVSLDPRRLDAMRSFTTDRIRNVTTETANRINREIGLAMIGAQSQSDAITAVQDTLQSSRSRALGIVRTEMGRAVSMATQQRMEQAQEVVPTLQKQWRRSGKTNSRINHDAIDGQVVDIDGRFTLVNKSTGRNTTLRYPRDPQAPIGETINCGCAQLPYNEEWEVRNKGKRPFTQRELEQSEDKRRLEAGENVRDII